MLSTASWSETRTMTRRRPSVFRAAALGLIAAACSISSGPAFLNTRTDACATCRMIVSDVRFASQIVARYEEPRFFDDLGCLRKYLETARLPQGAVVYVADHRTSEWVRADAAVFSRSSAVVAPMGSRFIAHVSAASRQSDPDAATLVAVDRRDVLGDLVPQEGAR